MPEPLTRDAKTGAIVKSLLSTRQRRRGCVRLRKSVAAGHTLHLPPVLGPRLRLAAKPRPRRPDPSAQELSLEARGVLWSRLEHGHPLYEALADALLSRYPSLSLDPEGLSASFQELLNTTQLYAEIAEVSGA
ncbi:MAG TPA: hypothetical protein VGN26_12645 [Armatimonadota bacterium]|jgi:hypothetical protein